MLAEGTGNTEDSVVRIWEASTGMEKYTCLSHDTVLRTQLSITRLYCLHPWGHLLSMPLTKGTGRPRYGKGI